MTPGRFSAFQLSTKSYSIISTKRFSSSILILSLPCYALPRGDVFLLLSSTVSLEAILPLFALFLKNNFKETTSVPGISRFRQGQSAVRAFSCSVFLSWDVATFASFPFYHRTTPACLKKPFSR